MKWDEYFHDVCEIVASKSPCLSRKIGAILVKDHSIVSTGYNGPPRGVPHCGAARFESDDELSNELTTTAEVRVTLTSGLAKYCPRKLLGFNSGEGVEWCTAQHAEENAVSNAARLGVSVLGTTLYMNSIIPCQKCFGTLINAGIEEIVVDSAIPYDKFTLFLISNSNIRIRSFKI